MALTIVEKSYWELTAALKLVETISLSTQMLVLRKKQRISILTLGEIGLFVFVQER